ncbi:MAG: hypothetical protein Q9184_006226 [Pyrenodesmia sp. 2 TL-2023]
MPSHPPTDDGNWRHRLGSPQFPIEPDRYFLYLGLFCPFAHRALLACELKGLSQYLPCSIVKPYPKEDGGWRFPSTDNEYPGSTVDRLFHSKFLHEVYFKSDPGYKGKYTVPVLWDTKTDQIVNNESEDIMRMLNTAFNDLLAENPTQRELHLYPTELQPQINEINSRIPHLDMGVYKAGTASDQKSYESSCHMVFDSLNFFEAHLAQHPNNIFFLGSITEIDVKLYTTLVRFDPVYQPRFNLMSGSIRQNYPHLHRWLKHMYCKVPGVKETTNFKHIKDFYSQSHADMNPEPIEPLCSVADLEVWTEEDEKWLVERDTA